MDDVRFGALARAARRRSRLRQADVARKAGVSQNRVSAFERGDLSGMTWGTIRRVAAAVQISVGIDARWRGAEGAHLLDRDHASLVERVVAMLPRSGWETLIEYSFNHFGDRGSVDIVGRHPATRSLLIVEVKTRLVDLQDLLSALDRKVRIVPGLLREERGWVARTVSSLLVAPDRSTLRRVVERHEGIFANAFPDRSVAVRRWIRAPRAARIAGLWFLSDSGAAADKQRAVGPSRVRLDPKPPPSGAVAH